MTRALLLLAMVGCVDVGYPDVGAETTGATLHPDAGAPTKCGPAPQMPGWSYTVVAATATDPGYAKVPEQQWFDHVAWTDAVRQWSACISAGGR